MALCGARRLPRGRLRSARGHPAGDGGGGEQKRRRACPNLPRGPLETAALHTAEARGHSSPRSGWPHAPPSPASQYQRPPVASGLGGGAAQLSRRPRLLCSARRRLCVCRGGDRPFVSRAARRRRPAEWLLFPVRTLSRRIENARDLGPPQIANSTQRSRCLKERKKKKKHHTGQGIAPPAAPDPRCALDDPSRPSSGCHAGHQEWRGG